jgi:hypothetical protein
MDYDDDDDDDDDFYSLIPFPIYVHALQFLGKGKGKLVLAHIIKAHEEVEVSHH